MYVHAKLMLSYERPGPIHQTDLKRDTAGAEELSRGIPGGNGSVVPLKASWLTIYYVSPA